MGLWNLGKLHITYEFSFCWTFFTQTNLILRLKLCLLSWVATPLSLARIVPSLNYNYPGTIILSGHFHLQRYAGSDDELWGYPVYKLNESYL